MAIKSISAIAATSKAPAQSTEAVPLRKLDGWEQTAIVTFLVLGTLLTVGTLLWFGLAHNGGTGFVSKTITTTGTGSTTKTVETDYSTTIVVFALTTGAAFILAGGLYGRLRDLTLGNIKIDLDDGSEKPA